LELTRIQYRVVRGYTSESPPNTNNPWMSGALNKEAETHDILTSDGSSPGVSRGQKENPPRILSQQYVGSTCRVSNLTMSQAPF